MLLYFSIAMKFHCRCYLLCPSPFWRLSLRAFAKRVTRASPMAFREDLSSQLHAHPSVEIASCAGELLLPFFVRRSSRRFRERSKPIVLSRSSWCSSSETHGAGYEPGKYSGSEEMLCFFFWDTWHLPKGMFFSPFFWRIFLHYS